jgi:hypothetical protein
MATHKLLQAGNPITITIQLTEDGDPVDLTSATSVHIKWFQDGVTTEEVAAVDGDPTLGNIKATLAQDAIVAGGFDAQARAVFGSDSFHSHKVHYEVESNL